MAGDSIDPPVDELPAPPALATAAPEPVGLDENAGGEEATVMMSRSEMLAQQLGSDPVEVAEEDAATAVLSKADLAEAVGSNEDTQSEAVPEPSEAPVDLEKEEVAASSVCSLRVRLGPEGPVLEGVVAQDATLAIACNWLHGALLPVETSLEGRLLAAWRLGTAEGPLPGETRISDASGEWVLHRVESAVRTLKVRIESEPEILSFKVASVVQIGAVVGLIGRHKNANLSEKWLHDGDRVVPHEALVDELSDSVLVLKG